MEEILFSKEEYEKMLQNRIKKPNVKFVSVKISPLSETAEGFMGEYYKIKIIYEVDGTHAEENFFVKTKPQKNKTQADISSEVPVYAKEIFFYDVMLKEFEKYGFETSFAAKSFYCVPNQTLVLEDLSLQGFKLPERNIFYDMDKIKCLLRALAQLHSAGFAYDKRKSEELGREYRLSDTHPEFTKEIMYVQCMEENNKTVLRWWKNSLSSLKKLTDLLPKDEAFKSKIKQLLNEFEFGNVFVKKTGLARTLGHGDLWSNNMMFRFENNVAVECKLVDYQCCRYFYPAFDVILAIYFNTSKEFRNKHLNQLYEYYHVTLSHILQEYGYDVETIVSENDFFKSIELLRPHALLQVAAVLLIIYLPKDTLTKAVDDDGTTYEEVMFDNEVIVAAEFQNSDLFRETMCVAIYDLYEAMEAATYV